MLAFALTALNAACATAPSDPLCLAVVPYGRADQAQAADELTRLAGDAVLRRLIEDYGALRARARAVCERSRR